MSDYITTKNLVKEIKKLGFGVSLDGNYIEVSDKRTDYGVATVNRRKMRVVDDTHYYWRFVDEAIQEKLYDLIDRYARTPLDKREEQKKYRLKLKLNKALEIKDGYLVRLRAPKGWVSESGNYCFVFTQTEIEAMGDLTKIFIKEEVCED